MGWNADNSRSRIKANADALGEIEITDLTQQMDLSNIKRRRPKRITGAHLYVALANEQRLVDDLLDAGDQDAARKPARLLHLYQREIARLIEDFGLARIHFQGARAHAINYRPASDHPKIAALTVGMAIAADLTMRRAFNPALPDQADLKVAAGAAFGQTLATMSGSNGDSELLFIGDAANHGAKAIDLARPLRATRDLVDLLDTEALGIEVKDEGDDRYSLSMTEEALAALAKRYDICWSIDACRKRIDNDIASHPLDSVSVSKAVAEIDKDRLSLAKCKLNDALSLFGDLDGFTAIVEAAMGDDAKLAALVRDFHLVRTELRHIAIQDYPPTLRVQFQGDRTQLLRHLPHADAEARALNAVKIAAAWNSALQHTLPDFITTDSLLLATGIADGPSLITKLGKRGHRDVIVVGPGVRRAERIQRNLDGGEIGIDGSTRDLLPDSVAALFDEWRPGPQSHTAKDLEINDVEYALKADSYDAGEAQSVSSSNGHILVGAAIAAGGLAVAAKAAARPRPTPQVEPSPAHTHVPRRRWAC